MHKTPQPNPFRLPDANTRFALPIICPTTGETISAEALYNRCCDALGYVLRDHIGDLIFDNLSYSADEAVCGTDESNAALHDAVLEWAASVRARLQCSSPVLLRYFVFQLIASSPDGRPIYSVADIAEPLPRFNRKVLRRARFIAGSRGYVQVVRADAEWSEHAGRRIAGVDPICRRCGIVIRGEGGHRCESCGRDI